jgi:hypothetical protein
MSASPAVISMMAEANAVNLSEGSITDAEMISLRAMQALAQSFSDRLKDVINPPDTDKADISVSTDVDPKSSVDLSSQAEAANSVAADELSTQATSVVDEKTAESVSRPTSRLSTCKEKAPAAATAMETTNGDSLGEATEDDNHMELD